MGIYMKWLYLNLELTVPSFKNIKSNSFRNGWFYTQDIFRKENDYYFIIDRKKDIYKNSLKYEYTLTETVKGKN